MDELFINQMFLEQRVQEKFKLLFLKLIQITLDVKSFLNR